MDNSSSPAPVKRWLRLIIVSLLLLVLFLIASGSIYENISEVRDRRLNPMPGVLVDGREPATVVIDLSHTDSLSKPANLFRLR